MTDPISRLSYVFGWARGLFLPFGLFALVAVGVHVGCDRLDDQSFVLLSWADGLFDRGSSWVVHAVGDALGLAAPTLDAFAAQLGELLDVERKERLARWIAVALELGTDLVIALPVFVYRAPPESLRALGVLLKRTATDLTVLRLTGPLAALAACVAGAFAVAREAQVAAHSLVATSRLDPSYAALAASTLGFLALAFVTWRLGAVVLLGAVTHADRRAARDLDLLLPARRRRLRGLLTALVALPITLTALDATPIVGTLRAFLWM